MAESVDTILGRGRRTVRGVAGVLAAVTVSLAVASAMHLSGQVRGRSWPYDAEHAGIAEAIIGTVLAVGVVVMLRSPARARATGLAAASFATAGFLWGLNMTARGGHWPDITYHLAVLPVLIGSVVLLARSRVRSRRP